MSLIDVFFSMYGKEKYVVNQFVSSEIEIYDIKQDEVKHLISRNSGSRRIDFKKKLTEPCKCCGTKAKFIIVGGSHKMIVDENYVPITIDHVQPRSRNGDNSRGNKQVMCHVCNNKKGNKV